MKNVNVFSAIVWKVKDQYPWKNIFLNGKCSWILGEKQYIFSGYYYCKHWLLLLLLLLGVMFAISYI